MNYYLNLFSPDTYEAFTESDQTVSGFRPRQRNAASKIEPGDRFICYMTKMKRWVGVLEVIEGPYEDDTPIFYEEDDPFVIRFKVKPVAWLPKDKTVPIYEDRVWDTLSFTRDHEQGTSTWTGKIRSSLGQLEQSDGEFLEEVLKEQSSNGETYPIDEKEYKKHLDLRVRRTDKVVSVSVPEDEEEEQTQSQESQHRESIRIQALIAEIGAKMGMDIWIPANDRSRVSDGAHTLNNLMN